MSQTISISYKIAVNGIADVDSNELHTVSCETDATDNKDKLRKVLKCLFLELDSSNKLVAVPSSNFFIGKVLVDDDGQKFVGFSESDMNSNSYFNALYYKLEELGIDTSFEKRDGETTITFIKNADDDSDCFELLQQFASKKDDSLEMEGFSVMKADNDSFVFKCGGCFQNQKNGISYIAT